MTPQVMKGQLVAANEFSASEKHKSGGKIHAYEQSGRPSNTMLPEVQPVSTHTVHSSANPTMHNSH